jgi:succinyl-CoA synthetase beta subunit
LDLFEFESKKEFAKHGIKIPKGTLVTNAIQTTQVIAKLKSPFMVKAQVLVGGRGKAGGILTAESVKEAEEAVAKLLEAQVSGFLLSR